MKKRKPKTTKIETAGKAEERYKSSLRCPFCGKGLDMRYDGFTCISAVRSAYVKGGIRLSCSDDQCAYSHSVLYKSDSPGTIRRMEKTMSTLVKALPNLGPWEKLQIDERPKRGHMWKRRNPGKG